MAEVAIKNETGKQATHANLVTGLTGPPPPAGDYKLVALGLNFTGGSMADEILSIGAYTIKDNKPKTYGQDILPNCKIGNASQRAHGVGLAETFSKNRFLYEIIEEWPGWVGKIISTKNETEALTSFMEWLETVKGDSKGIILIHHGNTIDNMMPQLLQALDRYKMTDAFYGIIHGCVNLMSIGADHPEMNGQSLSLISFLRGVLEFGAEELKRNSLRSASGRAELTYKIAMKIFNLPDKTDVSTGPLASCLTKDQERDIILAQKMSSVKIDSLRPIFRTRMKSNFNVRSHAIFLKRNLVDLGIDYDTLKAAHTSAGKHGIIKLIMIDYPKAYPAKIEDLKELVDVIFKYFEKTGKEKGKGKPRPPVDEDDHEMAEEAQGEK